ncbi:unnamed protein product [Prunus brigantina]
MAGEDETPKPSGVKPNTQDTETIDASDPFYIHHADQTGLTLVTQLLDGDNYATWSRAMLINLEAKNKLGFVDGTIKAPPTTSTKYLFWRRCNQLIKSWILNSISPSLANTVIYANTAAEVWSDLKERFSQGNVSRIFQIKREIAEMRQHQQSISTYYNMLKGLWDELGSYLPMPSCQCNPACKCGVMKELADREQQEQVLQFLMGLNDTYSAVRTQMLLMSPLPTVRTAYAMLMQEERQRQITENSTISSVHAMNTSKSTNKQPRKVHDDDNKNLHCTHCNGDTHTVDRCYYLNGFPTWHKLHGKAVKPPNKNKRVGANNTTQEPQKGIVTQTLDDLKFTPQEVNQIKSFLRGDGKIQAFANATGISHDSWIIDSGATDHISSSPKLIPKKTTLSNSSVNMPNGSQAHISCLGSVQITPHLKLEDVLCVPGFRVNLMSVSKLTRHLHCLISFFPTFCIMQDLTTKKMIGLGKEHDGLYYLVPVTEDLLCERGPRIAATALSSTSDLWHKRLGHLSTGPMRVLSQTVPSISFNFHSQCDVCPLAKQTRLPFSLSSISTNKPFELIHCDIWGPHRLPTSSGARYFLTIVDDYSRFTWLFLMNLKSETQEKIKLFFAYVKTQFHCDIQQVPLRRSTRSRQPNVRLLDYACSLG